MLRWKPWYRTNLVCEYAHYLEKGMDEQIRWAEPIVLTSMRKFMGQNPRLASHNKIWFNNYNMTDSDCPQSLETSGGKTIQIRGCGMPADPLAR